MRYIWPLLVLLLGCGGSGGQAPTATAIITVSDQPILSVAYDTPIGYCTKGSTIEAISPHVIGGTATSYSIAPNLPNGLAFKNGTISGTPESESPLTTYTITASNSISSVSTTVRLGVQDISTTSIEQPVSFTYHLNQSIQMPDDSVPIVEGRTVGVQIWTTGIASATIQMPDGFTVSGVSNGKLALTIPGSHVSPGSYRLTVGNETITRVLKTVQVPRVPITIIPIVTGGVTPPINLASDGRTLLEKTFIRMIPQRDDLDIQIGPPMITDYPADPVDSQWGDILIALENKRKKENPSRIYYGLVYLSPEAVAAGKSANHRLGGVALGSGASAIGRYDNYQAFAHEFGHNAGLPDIYLDAYGGTLQPQFTQLYPYSHGEVRGYGFDVLGLTDLPYDDSMCELGYRVDLMIAPNGGFWISDFHWKFMIKSLNAKIIN